MPKKTKKPEETASTEKSVEVKPENQVVEVKEEPKTEAQKIWEEIQNVQLNMFALPDQTVVKYCKPYMIETNKLYVTLTASAALVALEDSLGKKFHIVPAGQFIMIYRK